MFGNAYQGRRVLVTGHTGFKGSWLCAWLLELGAELAGVALDPPGSPAHYHTLGLEKKLADMRLDVRDAARVEAAVANFAPDIIFHLAAQPLVRKSYVDPGCTFSTNMLGTLNVLEAMRRHQNVRAAVIITSDKCYRNQEWIYGYRESDRLGGADPYSASKGCAELIARSYFESFFTNGPACATARAGNVIGGGDWAQDRIVPDCARAWSAGKAVSIRNPGATRPWQHVLEPLSGYLWLGSLLLGRASAPDGQALAGQAFNFGPDADASHTVGELAAALARFWPGFACELGEEAGPHEFTLLRLCCDKALAELEWHATLNFEETVEMTASWYARYYAGQGNSMLDCTLGQIRAYCQRAQARGLPWSNGHVA